MTETIQYKKLGSVQWDRGRFDVQALGGMLGPVEVVLDDGRAIRPFALAPWADNPTEDWEATAPPLLKRLRGDWVCLPFGLPGKPRTDLDPDWLEGLEVNLESPIRRSTGRCSNLDWRLEKAEPRALSMSFSPDANFPISRIERRISAADGDPAITVETRIAARAACELQWGCHPTFRPAAGARRVRYRIWRRCHRFTYPGFFEAGVSRIAHGQTAQGSARSPCSMVGPIVRHAAAAVRHRGDSPGGRATTASRA